MQKSHFLGFFLVHQEVDGLTLIAEFTLRVGDLRTDICQIPYLFRDFGPDGQFWLCRRDSLAELHVKSDGIVRTATETVIPLRGCAKGLLFSSCNLVYHTHNT